MEFLNAGDDCALRPANGSADIASLAIGVTWDCGGLDSDVCAIICDDSGRVLDNSGFLFWDNRSVPGDSVLLRQLADGPRATADRAQVLVNVGELPSLATQILVCLATLAESLAPVRDISVHVFDLVGGTDLVTIPVHGITDASCLELVQLRRDGTGWRIVALGEPYVGGLHAWCTDHGVTVGG